MYFANYKTKSPCIFCDKRIMGCHANCLLYKKYKTEIFLKEEEEKFQYQQKFIYDTSVLRQHRSYR